MKRKDLNAVMTIEMAVIIPLILFIVMGLILTIFYFHDKNIFHGAAGETAMVASAKYREDEEIDVSQLEQFCMERLQGKCIFLTTPKVTIQVSDTETVVEISASKGNFSVSAVRRAAVTAPETKIRNIRRLQIKNGKKDND